MDSHDFAGTQKNLSAWAILTAVVRSAELLPLPTPPPSHTTGKSGAFLGVCCPDETPLVHYLPDTGIALQKKCWQLGLQYLQSVSQIKY